MQYRAEKGQRLDAILRAVYGEADMLGEVIAANPGLASIGPVFPEPRTLTLPEPPAAPITVKAGVRLWD